MSLMALAVFPVSFLEWTNTRTWRKQVRVRKLQVAASSGSSLELEVNRLQTIIIALIFNCQKSNLAKQRKLLMSVLFFF